MKQGRNGAVITYGKFISPLVGLIIAAISVTIALFSIPSTATRIVLTTGAAGSSYSAFAEQYNKYFATRGVDLEFRQTQGLLENARLVADSNSPVEIA